MGLRVKGVVQCLYFLRLSVNIIYPRARNLLSAINQCRIWNFFYSRYQFRVENMSFAFFTFKRDVFFWAFSLIKGFFIFYKDAVSRGSFFIVALLFELYYSHIIIFWHGSRRGCNGIILLICKYQWKRIVETVSQLSGYTRTKTICLIRMTNHRLK